MPLHNIDMTAALRRLAERRLDEAIREGKFDNLEGAGKPLDLEPMPANEDTRMTWWALRILRRNEFVPDEVRLRKAVDHLKANLAKLRDESRLVPLVEQINKLVRQINTLGTNALSAAMVPVDLETEQARLRQRLLEP